jgi:hypothetical protein
MAIRRGSHAENDDCPDKLSTFHDVGGTKSIRRSSRGIRCAAAAKELLQRKRKPAEEPELF